MNFATTPKKKKKKKKTDAINNYRFGQWKAVMETSLLQTVTILNINFIS